jgi:arsenite methyltransferase
VTGVDCRRPGGLELTDRLVTAAVLPVGAAVLDVGCGAGATVAHLVDEYGLCATGIDSSAERTTQASDARPDLDFLTCRAEELPFTALSFDAVLCECVLSTLSAPGRALCEVVRVLRPGGVVLISDLYVRDGDEVPAGGRIATLGSREAVETLLAACGLHVAQWQDESGALGRYIWDLAPHVARRHAGPQRRQPMRRFARRLGYFTCLARLLADEGQRSLR